MRLQTQSKDGAPKNTWDVVKELGVKGLYEGAGVTMARDVPSSAIFFACYTLLRQLYPEQSFLAGCVAAIPATILVTPMDIIKTRLQVCTIFREREREREDSDFSTSMILGVVPSSSWSINSRPSQILEALQRLIPLFKGDHLEWAQNFGVAFFNVL